MLLLTRQCCWTVSQGLTPLLPDSYHFFTVTIIIITIGLTSSLKSRKELGKRLLDGRIRTGAHAFVVWLSRLIKSVKIKKYCKREVCIKKVFHCRKENIQHFQRSFGIPIYFFKKPISIGRNRRIIWLLHNDYNGNKDSSDYRWAITFSYPGYICVMWCSTYIYVYT